MQALVFLWKRQLINTVREILKKPMALIGYTLMALLLLGVVVTSFIMPQNEFIQSNAQNYDLVITAGALAILLLGWNRGASNGTSFFYVSDVNLVFPSPIEPKQILLYGMANQLMLMLMWIFILLFQTTNIRNFTGATNAGILGMVLAVAVMVFAAQMLTMLIYCWSAGHPRRRNLMLYTLYALVGVVVLCFLQQYMRTGQLMSALQATLVNPVTRNLPIVGWAAGMAISLNGGQYAQGLLYALLLAGGCAILGWLLLRLETDYYEDMVDLSAKRQARRDAKRKGNQSLDSINFIRKKQTASQPMGGWGASAFLFRQLRETSRRAFLGSLDMLSLLLIGMGAFFGYVFSTGMEGELVDAPVSVMTILLFLLSYMQLFYGMTGAWVQEQRKPYLYLAPVQPGLKLVAASVAPALKTSFDGLIALTVGALICRASAVDTLLCIVCFASYCLLYNVADMVRIRLVGQRLSKGLSMLSLLFISLLLVAPGIVLYFIVAIFVHSYLGYALLLVWNLLATAGGYLLCRSLLHEMEYD